MTDNLEQSCRSDEVNALSSLLSEVGLNPEKWITHFKDVLGITSPVALNYLTAENQTTIISCKDQDWEENALMRVFEKAKHEQEAITISGESDEQLLSSAGGAAFKEKTADGCQRYRKISEAIPRRTNESGQECLTPEELIKTASAGSALCGVFLTRDPLNIRTAEPVIKCPKPVELIAPRLESKSETISIASKNLHEVFKSSVRALGISIATKIAATAMNGATAGASYSASRKTESKMEVSREDTKTYKSVSITCIRPIQAVRLNVYTMTFTDDALAELQKIEKELQYCSNLEVINSQLQQFFEHFGSHINKGVLHLGGIFEQNGSYESERSSENEITDDMVINVIKSRAELATLAGEGVRLDAGLDTKSGEQSKEVDKQLEQKINCKTTIYGGSIKAKNEIEWEKSLMENGKNLAIIDRGTDIGKDFAGIWDILNNHKKKFRYPSAFGLFLKYSWHQFHGDIETFKVTSHEQEKEFANMLLDQKIQDLKCQTAQKIGNERKNERQIENVKERLRLCKEVLGEANEFVEEKEIEVIQLFGQENWAEAKTSSGTCSDARTLLGTSKKTWKEHKRVPMKEWCYAIRIINPLLYVCCTNALSMYNSELQLVETIALPRSGRVHDVVRMENVDLVAAADNGLYLLTKNDKNEREVIIRREGAFTSICLLDNQIYTAKRDGDICVYDLIEHWKQIRAFRPPCSSTKHSITLMIYKNKIICCCAQDHTLCIMSLRGDPLYSYGQYGSGNTGMLYGPRLCDIDEMGTVLVADKYNHRLQIVDANGEWKAIYQQPPPRKPRRAVLWGEKLLVLAGYDMFKHVIVYSS